MLGLLKPILYNNTRARDIPNLNSGIHRDMLRNIKTHIRLRVLEFLKQKTDLSSISECSLPIDTLTVGNIKQNGETELRLPISSIKTSLKKNHDFSYITFMPTDDIIHSIDYISSEMKSNYIVFQVNKSFFIKEVLQEVTDRDWKQKLSSFLSSESKQKKLVIDYSSPNIAKPFHMGHLRSTIIGQFISNLFEFLSYDVIRLNYLGDWGTQFGLLEVGLQLCDYSDKMIKENPIELLFKAYVEANKRAEKDPSLVIKARELFNLLEKGEQNITHKWSDYRHYTIQELESVYQRLGVVFDDYCWESMYSTKYIEHVLHSLKAKGILKKQEDDKQVVELNNQRKVTLLKSDGSTLYLTRDIAAAIDRYEKYHFDKMFYVVDNAQTDHFFALFEIISKMEYSWAHRLQHIKFGRVRGMSTRKGSAVFLKDILDEAKDIMRRKQLESPTTKITFDKSSETTADVLGISAVIVNDLKQRRQKDYKFDWEKALQMQGDTGVKLQYTHCRLWSLQKNCGAFLPEECDPNVLQEDEALMLVQDISRFPEIIKKSHDTLEASILTNYLLKFCNSINRAFNTLRIKNEDSHIASQRLLLFYASRIVLSEGMRILGLKPLKEM